MHSLEVVQPGKAPASFGIDDDPRWGAVQRILASKSFSKSGRLSAFLTYICRCALEGRSDEISEQQIGIHVFDRPADYNPGDDNIVRTTARQLRQRLALYYQEEGAAEDLHIEVPRGGYHPDFVCRTDHNSPVESLQNEAGNATASRALMPETVPKATLHVLTPLLALCLAFICGVGVVLIGQRIVRQLEVRHSADNALWSEIFVPGKPTIFVPGDAGLNIYSNLARTQVNLGDYVSGVYLSTPEAQTPNGYTWAPLATRRYVSWVDLEFADKLRQIEMPRQVQYSIKFARDIHPDDLRNSNVILIGAPTYNPWVEMFASHLNFHLSYDGEHNAMTVLNRKPANGEPSEYTAAGGDSSHLGYTHGFGYIALTTNLDGNGRVLIIEGSTIAGVDASVSFLMSDSRMTPILSRASQKGRGLASFEVLLKADFLKSSSPDAQILATRFYPAK